MPATQVLPAPAALSGSGGRLRPGMAVCSPGEGRWGCGRQHWGGAPEVAGDGRAPESARVATGERALSRQLPSRHRFILRGTYANPFGSLASNTHICQFLAKLWVVTQKKLVGDHLWVCSWSKFFADNTQKSSFWVLRQDMGKLLEMLLEHPVTDANGLSGWTSGRMLLAPFRRASDN